MEKFINNKIIKPSQWSQTKNLYVNVQKGLCNRLRAYASAELLAKKTNRNLIVIWKPDYHCEARFNDLFKNKVNIIDSPDLVDPVNMDIYNCMDNEPGGGKKEQFINHDTNNDIYIKTAYSLNYDFSSIKSENEFLKNLKPVDKISILLKTFPDINDCIGIHVRQGGGAAYNDTRWDSPDEMTGKGKEHIYYWRQKSKPEYFLLELKKILKKNRKQKFFLASDHKEIYDFFTNKYSNSIVYLPRNCFDRSIEQQYYALADLYLLSKTKYILGSYWSSFTEIAQRLGNKDTRFAGIDFGDIDFNFYFISRYRFLKRIIKLMVHSLIGFVLKLKFKA